MRFVSLASGSKGNGYLVQAGEVTVLVDAGLSGRELERRAQGVGVMMSDVDLIVLTHEHSDHIRSAGLLSRRYCLPVYGTEGTLRNPCGRIKPVAESTDRFEILPAGETLTLASLSISSFSISHDAADPVGYSFAANGHRLVLAADLGYVTRLVAQRLRQANAVVLESNHCPDMLAESHYPLWLQRRITGKQGHLSNQDAARALCEYHHAELRYVVLAHLSENNNTPDKAYRQMHAALAEEQVQTHLRVAPQQHADEWIDLEEECAP